MRQERALAPSPPSPRQGGKRHMELFVEAADSLAAQADGWQVCHWLNVLVFSFSFWGVKQSVEWSIAQLTNPQLAFLHTLGSLSHSLSQQLTKNQCHSISTCPFALSSSSIVICSFWWPQCLANLKIEPRKITGPAIKLFTLLFIYFSWSIKAAQCKVRPVLQRSRPLLVLN